MKYIVTILLAVLSVQHIQANSIYLWEFVNHGDRSCCLSLSGYDICNPNQPCTRTVSNDLRGIYDYVNRLLNLEKSNSFSCVGILNQAKSYIDYVLHAPYIHLSYLMDQHRPVRFLHDLIQEAKNNEKNGKAQTSAAGSSLTDKPKGQDKVFAYLVSQGLAREFKK